ncbi:MAG: M48 family metalloprotease [Candidatus Bathyarchaeia archaeon]
MEIKTQEEILFMLHVEVSPAYHSDLLLFIYRKYIVPYYHRFANVRRWIINGKETLAFTLLGPSNFWYVDVEITSGEPMEIKIKPSGPNVPPEVLNRIKEDLIITIQMFEDEIRRRTLYFVWGPEKRLVDEKALTQRKKILSQIFTGNMLLLFIIFLLFSYFMFSVAWILGILEYAPLLLLLSQFILVLFADKIVMQMGDWLITRENSKVYILQYHIPPEDLEFIKQNYPKERLLQIKREIYERTMAIRKTIDSETVQEVFLKYGIRIRPENLLIKSIDIYRIVDDVAKKFGMPTPKIAVANIIIPNAAATGPRPRSSLVLITSGLLIQLDEEEISAVLGHEISHVKGRDPLIFFLLASSEYLLRVYVVLRYLPYLVTLFGFLYLFFALTVIYFIAKFFEARADLESAIVLGKADALANALRKIGYRRLLFERNTNIIGAWLGMDPHPPLSFRIERLESVKLHKVKHPLLQSIKDCIRGLLSEIAY